MFFQGIYQGLHGSRFKKIRLRDIAKEGRTCTEKYFRAIFVHFPYAHPGIHVRYIVFFTAIIAVYRLKVVLVVIH